VSLSTALDEEQTCSLMHLSKFLTAYDLRELGEGETGHAKEANAFRRGGKAVSSRAGFTGLTRRNQGIIAYATTKYALSTAG